MTTESTWSLYDLPMAEDSTKYFEYKKVYEQSVSEPDSKTRYTFNIRDVDSYILPSKAYLQVGFKITKQDKANLVTNASTGPFYAIENGFPIFSEATYKVADKIIEQVENLKYKQLVQNLLEYSDDYAKSSATDQYWYKDDGTLGGTKKTQYGTFTNLVTATTVPSRLIKVGANADDPVLAVAGGTAGTITYTTTLAGGQIPTKDKEYNSGFDARSDIVSNSKLVSVRIPLSRIFGYCKSVHKVSTGVSHTIEFTRAILDDVLHTSQAIAGTNEDPRLFINSMFLWVPYLKPSLSTQLFVEKQLNSGGSQIYPIEYTNVYKKENLNENNLTWLINSTTERPQKVIVFFRKTIASEAQKRLENKSIFTNLDVSRASLSVAGKKLPEIDYEPVWDDNDYNRLYHEMLTVSGKDMFDLDTGTQITFTEFKDLYSMICFDLRDSGEGLFTPGVASDLIFRAKVTVPGAGGNFGAGYSVYSVVVSERVLKLDVISRQTRIDIQ